MLNSLAHGVATFVAVRGPNNDICDFELRLANPAASQLLRGHLPAGPQPEGSYRLRTELPSHFLHELFARWVEVVNTGQPVSIDQRLEPAEGAEEPDWLHLHVHRLDDGVLVSLTDITEQRRTAETLKREQEFVRQVIDTMPNPIFVKDASGRFVIANRVIAAMYGVEPSYMIGRKNTDLLSRPEEQAKHAQVEQELLRTGQMVTREVSFTRHDGSIRWFKAIKLPLAGPDGKPHILGISIDITAHKEHAERLSGIIAELEQKQQVLREQLRVNEEQRELIDKLSLPVVEVWDSVLTLPLLGTLGNGRITEVTAKLLAEITRTRARFVVLDLTGLADVDSGAAAGLVRMARAVALLGARTIFTGVQKEVAQQMSALGPELTDLSCFATLRSGLRACMAWQAGAAGRVAARK
jgi:rsbT co-antagonist protein RsbR